MRSTVQNHSKYQTGRTRSGQVSRTHPDRTCYGQVSLTHLNISQLLKVKYFSDYLTNHEDVNGDWQYLENFTLKCNVTWTAQIITSIITRQHRFIIVQSQQTCIIHRPTDIIHVQQYPLHQNQKYQSQFIFVIYCISKHSSTLLN